MESFIGRVPAGQDRERDQAVCSGSMLFDKPLHQRAELLAGLGQDEAFGGEIELEAGAAARRSRSAAQECWA